MNPLALDLGALFGAAETTLNGAIADVAPIALGIGASVLAITFGWNLVRRFVH